MRIIGMDEMKSRLRKLFRDEHKIQWSDALLDDILLEAQREYALYSGKLTGEYDVFTVDSPVQTLPEDFVEVISVQDADGKDIPVVSYRKLAEDHGDFREHRGDKAKSFCFNFDSFGKFRVYPVLPPGTFAGKITYKRLPRENEWGGNSNAIEQHAMFQMYQFTGKSMAQNCFYAFLDLINQEQPRQVAIGNKNIVRTGNYF